MKEWTKEAIRAQPADLIAWSAQFVARRPRTARDAGANPPHDSTRSRLAPRYFADKLAGSR